MDSRWNKSARKTESRSTSFSSTLLDAIYRSIDGEEEDELVLYRETMRKKQSNGTAAKGRGGGGGFEDDASVRRASMVSEQFVVRRKSVADLERKSRSIHRQSMFPNSSSSPSNPSSGGALSSSETKPSVQGASTRSHHFTQHRPKPIRTNTSVQPENLNKHENGTAKIKSNSNAMKMYGDFKKVKQPSSPGGRIASFLNSIFTAGNAKKSKISSTIGACGDTISKSGYDSTTFSSASSFSGSCLSKTPSSSRGKSSNGTKRSVRFHPVSVIVDEDSRPCGHKSLCQDELSLRNTINAEIKLRLVEKNRRVEEAAGDLFMNYQKKKVGCVMDPRNAEEFDDDDDDEEDDLFELHNLSDIGIERYREELPVYGSTHLRTNRAIASGLIL